MLRLAQKLWLARVAAPVAAAVRPACVPAPRLTPTLGIITTPRRWQSTAAFQEFQPEIEVESTLSTGIPRSLSTIPQVVLRPYQEVAITSCLDALQSGLTRIGVSSPTGSGKTTMFMSLIPKVFAQEERNRTLILVSSVELASQAEGAAKRLLGPDWTVEMEQGKRTASGTADV